MDIQHLVDRLEDLIDEGRHVPMSRYTLIDEERALEIIDQMRISIPEQIEKATRVVNQRDRLLAQANEEATRMIELARQKNEDMISRDAIVQTAQHRADNLVRQAQLEAEKVRDEADSYVMEVLKDLESHLLRTLTIVRNGITKLVQDREIRAQSMIQMQREIKQAQQEEPKLPADDPSPLAPPQAQPQEERVQVEQEELVDAE
ncbi:MAG: ATP synthase F0 subunit B [Chloroflexi bacterium]|nr:ATP synthase F0 subunit B [Chloroflexota bacterium]